MAKVPENGEGLTWADLTSNKNKQCDTNDVMNMMQLLLEQQSKMSNDINKRLDKQSAMLDDMINKMKQRDEKWERDRCKLKENKESDLNQVSSSDSGGNNNDDTFTNNCVNLSVVEIKNEVSEVNTNNNQKEVSLNVKQVAVNMVSNNVSYDDVNKSEILLKKNNGDILSNSGSNIESRKSVEVRGLLVSDHNELERESRDSLNVEGEQGANVSGVQCEAKTSQVVHEDKRSSLGHLGDNGSAKDQNRFLCISGTARWCYNKVVLPFVWSENVKLGWESEGLVGGINIERNDYIISNVDLPWAVVNNDNDYIDAKYVPVGRISVLVVADKYDNEVTYLGVTINTNGDWTKNTDVDLSLIHI